MKNRHEEKAKISFIFYYVNRISEVLQDPPEGLLNVLVSFNTLGAKEKELFDLKHEIILANYYFDIVLLLESNINCLI